MFKTQLKFQKIMSYAMLIIAAIAFVYSLGIMTNVYDSLYQATRSYLGEDGNMVYVERVEGLGALLYYEMQPFNKLLLSFSIVLIVISLTLFITGSHTRRLYHVGNYVSAALVSVSNIAVAIWGMVEVGIYKEKFMAVDFEALKKLSETRGFTYSESTLTFDLGYVIFPLLIVAALVCVGNLIWKVLLMKRESELLNGNTIKEVAVQ